MEKIIIPSREPSQPLDIDFILTHFSEPIFPRTISTFKSKGKQFEVFNKEEMKKAYEESKQTDCRVNAYPSYTEYKGIQRYPPNFVFADLDLSSFKNKDSLDRSLHTTLRTIRIKIDGNPTVLWTGNGYHIYQPLDSLILEQYPKFDEFEHPSMKFIRFAEQYLTSETSDPSHSPSFKSCMIRIPGSFNSKCSNDNNKIKIIQKWDGYRPPIKFLLRTFRAYLVNEKFREVKFQKKFEKVYGFKTGQTELTELTWIETLLQTPIHDYRKNAIALILSRYLVNIKKLAFEDAYQAIKTWVSLCNELRSLDENIDYKIKYSLNAAIRNRRLPMSFSTLEKKNKGLYNLLKTRMPA